MKSYTILSGQDPHILANALSDTITASVQGGLPLDAALCVAAQVVADYARGEYGPAYVEELVGVMRQRLAMPLPTSSGQGGR